jgi:hypothetical protein
LLGAKESSEDRKNKDTTEKFETLRLDAEEILFYANAVQQSSLRRNAAIRPSWYWLPRNGLDQLVKFAVQRGSWRSDEGRVAKKWERRTRVTRGSMPLPQTRWRPGASRSM